MNNEVFSAIMQKNEIAISGNRRLFVCMVSAFFIWTITITGFTGRRLDVEIIMMGMGFALLVALTFKMLDLREYFDKLEETISQETNSDKSRPVPHWITYHSGRAFWWTCIGLIVLVSSAYLRRPFGIRQLPLFGLIVFLLLNGFALLLSLRGYLGEINEHYHELHHCPVNDARSDEGTYTRKYWLIFFTVFSAATMIIGIPTYLMKGIPDLFMVLSYSSIIAFAAASIMGLAYSYRALRKLLADLDRIKAISEGGGTGIHSDVSC